MTRGLIFDQQKGRPISELPIPKNVQESGEEAVSAYRDDHRLAYQSEAPVNWCPELGTVLANEEVIGGLSEAWWSSSRTIATAAVDVTDHSIC